MCQLCFPFIPPVLYPGMVAARSLPIGPTLPAKRLRGAALSKQQRQQQQRKETEATRPASSSGAVLETEARGIYPAAVLAVCTACVKSRWILAALRS